MELENLSQELLEKARKEEDAEELIKRLQELNTVEIVDNLKNDEARKAFWINIYNAYSQILLREKPERYRFKSIFFMRRYINIAGQKMSLNKIENGYLRSSKLSIGFGYLKNPLARKFARKIRVDEVDPRVHFALNCGAKTCPPIRFYMSEDLDNQLEKATENYLNQEVEVSKNRLEVPRVFLWYRGDFGGGKGVKQFLSKYGHETSGKKIRYKNWNWELQLNSFEDTK